VILGIFDRHFFEWLAASGVRLRMVDDPMTAGSVELLTVGVGGLYADQPIDGPTMAPIKAHEPILRALVGGFGIAELQRAGHLNERDGSLLARLLVDPDIIDYLLRPEIQR